MARHQLNTNSILETSSTVQYSSKIASLSKASRSSPRKWFVASLWHAGGHLTLNISCCRWFSQEKVQNNKAAEVYSLYCIMMMTVHSTSCRPTRLALKRDRGGRGK